VEVEGVVEKVVTVMSLLNDSLCIFANSMSDTTEEVNNVTYLVHYYS
jgi:hypothetical protein